MRMVLGACLGLASCGGSHPTSTAHSAPPAHVSAPVSEEAQAVVTLEPAAHERLGIECVKAEEVLVDRLREFPGVIAEPYDARPVLVAPLAARIEAAEGVPFPRALQRVSSGEVLFALHPALTVDGDVLTPTQALSAALQEQGLALGREDAAAALASARTRLATLETQLERALDMQAQQVGSLAAVEDARLARDLARTDLESAERRLELLSRSRPGADADPLLVRSPRSGLLVDVPVGPGVTVPAGARLAQVLDDSNAWVVVPCYVGDLERLDREAPALVRRTPAWGGEEGPQEWSAVPVPGPLGADPARATVDLVYALPPAAASTVPGTVLGTVTGEPAWQAGQRVEVRLASRESDRATSVPWSAVVIDFDGGTWVYEELGERRFKRRRVWIRRRQGDLALLEAGPAPGARVVSVGAVELFGTEFGVGH